MLGQYNPQESEKKWQDIWYKSNLYHWDESLPREQSYVIDTPPPTVSGMLHMGHVFSYTQTDFLARFYRMYGKNVFYPIGFDDNGLPTERLVEKQRGIRAIDLERSEFIKICKEVVHDAEEEFRVMFKSLALSVDWRQEYQTINDNCRKLSQMSFLDLYEKSKAVRRQGPTFWDPVDQTAIAQAEMEDKERNGIMYNIIFKLCDESGNIEIATTRPEMLAACAAVFVHPDDKRYTHLHNQYVKVPLFDHHVRIIPDADVDQEKGTGAVMCATFGDMQDIIWWRRHHLKLNDIIAKNGQMQNTSYANGSYDGMYIKDARKKAVLDLRVYITAEREVLQNVKCAERSGAPLEIITTSQWYVTILDIKDQIIKKANQAKWFPEYMKKRLEIWTEGLNQDWCISRQRYFGVPFPVWYSKRPGEEGKILLAEIDQLPVDPLVDLPKGYKKHEVLPDCDVMDTWATSSISPSLNSMAINQRYAIDLERHKKLYPADLRPQAHEIIRTWAFYTITKSLLHADTAPWHNVAISGWCLASDKTKMSKSKGNVVTPTELIVTQGTDVVRYWASTSKLGVDIRYSEDMFKIGKKLLNKLYNACKFASSHFAKDQTINHAGIKNTLDLWIVARLKDTIAKATKAFLENEYCDARVCVEDFFWNDFCDNYLELVKGRIYSDDKESAAATLYTVCHTLLRLFAPFMPHICEELNHSIFGGGSVHEKGSWPNENLYTQIYDKVAMQDGENAKYLIELVRKFKSQSELSLKAEIESIKYSGPKLSNCIIIDIKNAGNIKEIIYADIDQSDQNIVTIDNNPYTIAVHYAKSDQASQ